MTAQVRPRFAAYPTRSNHENGELRRDVMHLPDGEAVRRESLEDRIWILDGHDSHIWSLKEGRQQVPFRQSHNPPIYLSMPAADGEAFAPSLRRGIGMSAVCTPVRRNA